MSTQKIVKGETVDITELVEQAMGSDMFIKEMIAIFIRTIPLEVERLKTAIDEKNYEDIYAIAHKIKPNYHFVGLPQLQALLFEVEQIAREEGSLVDISEKFKQVETTTAKAVGELAAILQTY